MTFIFSDDTARGCKSPTQIVEKMRQPPSEVVFAKTPPTKMAPLKCPLAPKRVISTVQCTPYNTQETPPPYRKK